MTSRRDNMTFGTFMAPFHRVGENPTLALERDLELIEWLDDLGFDEAWIGEHHSGGWETIASPEGFIATAAVVIAAPPPKIENVRWIWDARTINQGSGPLALGPSRRASMTPVRAAPMVFQETWETGKNG